MNPSVVNYRTPQEVGATIGQVLREQGKLTPLQSEKVMLRQRETGTRFGEAAVSLGFVSLLDVDIALSVQFSYPHMALGQDEFSSLLIAAFQPASPQVEALRGLRSQLQLHWLSQGKKVLTVVSQNESCTARLLAANLSIVFSQLGENTLLIDADLRRSPLGKLFGIDSGPGLSEILSHRASIEVIQKIEELRSLSVLTAGVVPPNPQDLLSRSGLEQLLVKLRPQFDVIIMNTPPSHTLSDAMIIAARADGVVLSADAGHTPVAELERLRHQLRQASIDVLGCVLNESGKRT